jgi:8-oxo-dGTP diphosphatase
MIVRKNMLEKTFGVRLEHTEYRDRTGVYTVVLDNGFAATVRTPEGNFLIGGGVEYGESHMECLKRECAEETGYGIESKGFICKGDLYFYADLLSCYLHSIGYFYLAELTNKICEPSEADHILEWIPIDEPEKHLVLEHQIWAVKEAVRLYNTK